MSKDKLIGFGLISVPVWFLLAFLWGTLGWDAVLFVLAVLTVIVVSTFCIADGISRIEKDSRKKER